MDNEYIDFLNERLKLSRSRLGEIKLETVYDETFSDYFRRGAEYIGFSLKVVEDLPKLKRSGISIKREINHKLYEYITPEMYKESYANPEYASKVLGDAAPYLSFLCAEVHAFPAYIYDGRLEAVASLTELFLEIYHMFLDQTPSVKQLKEAVFYYAFDYAEYYVYMWTESRFLGGGPAEDIVGSYDLTDISYLYDYGEYITENEIKTAEFYNSLSDKEIAGLAGTFTKGFRRGFDTMRIDFSSRKTVSIRYFIGQERLVREAVRQFSAMGLKVILNRPAVSRIVKRGISKQGYETVSHLRQFEYDHRMDDALFLNNKFIERKLSAQRDAFKDYAEEISVYGGPAVLEAFGENEFDPVQSDKCIVYSDSQRDLFTQYLASQSALTEEFLPGDTYSFTIMAFPVPEIGDDFEEVFRRTAELNVLDNDKYILIQQHIIDALDPAEYVLVKGKGGNETDIRVSLRQISDPRGETQFENCVADVNIPLGEVFTSPVLKGTEGVLHVSRVYINGLVFKDLKLTFKDGIVTDYICSNYEDEEKCRDYINDNIMFDHRFLPIGEFAIGTNTEAYAMGKELGIMEKLPILIMEKTGPHFAVGDTCYSHAEDKKVYNPDGKEIISRDNDYSLLRTTEPEKAYFNCHTDITIPFEELGFIRAVGKESAVDIIRDGRFVLPGTEELNIPLDRLGGKNEK